MELTPDHIVEEARRHGNYYADLVGFGRRVAQRSSRGHVTQEEDQAKLGARVILAYYPMWEVTAQGQPPESPCQADALTYLITADVFLKRWASREAHYGGYTQPPEFYWHKAQDGFAEVSRWHIATFP